NGPPIEIAGSGSWSSVVTYGSAASNWITLVNMGGPSLPAQANFSVDRSNLTQPGTYTATIAITTSAGTQNVNVNVVVIAGAVLRATPAGLTIDDQTSSTQVVFFNSSDGSQFDLRGAVTPNAPWISVGTINPGQQTLAISIDRTGLPQALYN